MIPWILEEDSFGPLEKGEARRMLDKPRKFHEQVMRRHLPEDRVQEAVDGLLDSLQRIVGD
ncbi:hypothetical protein [Streptomyces sp. NPDC088752]|uniref:hypothetical protein n=1 Tax=Streptomyces sp. NPDC088752 TaxID=3154963 RepID=UPI003421F28A